MAGLTLSVFEPKSPVPIPTPDGLFQAAVATNSDIMFCVPAFIEVLINISIDKKHPKLIYSSIGLVS
jgi:hypothetical protein